MDGEERIIMLEKARAMLLEAADLMDSALKMSGIEQRSGDDSSAVRRIASDPSYGGSISNIILDLQRLEDDPVWTQPLTSPKNLFSLKPDDAVKDSGQRQPQHY